MVGGLLAQPFFDADRYARRQALIVDTVRNPTLEVINEENISESKVALVYGQMNEPLGARTYTQIYGPPR